MSQLCAITTMSQLWDVVAISRTKDSFMRK